MEEVHVNDVIADPNKTSYMDTILSFDWDKDGKMRMYRVMGKGEAKNVLQNKGLHTRPKQPSQEIWLSTSIKHFRQFENKRVKDHSDDVVMAFKVDMKKFREEFDDEDIIQQGGSSALNKGKTLPELKNLVHKERIGDHRWGKLNLCLKGEENAKKFNKCVLWTELAELKIVKEGERNKIVNPDADDTAVHSSESMAPSDFSF